MKLRSYFIISMISFFLSSIFVFLITIVDRQQYLMASNILAIGFWITLISGIVFCVIFARKIKQRRKSRLQFLKFFKGNVLIVIDTIMIVSILCSVIIGTLHINITLLWALILFFDIATIEFHFLFSITNREEYTR